MINVRYQTDPGSWQEVRDDNLSYKMRYDFQCLGWDRASASIDFVLRFGPDGGHCQRHRHIADSTVVLVLDGEQHLDELRADGTTSHKSRAAGEYHRSNGADALPHMERGGPEGAIIFYACQARDGRLFEFVDDKLNLIREVTIDDMISSWQRFRADVTPAAATS